MKTPVAAAWPASLNLAHVGTAFTFRLAGLVHPAGSPVFLELFAQRLEGLSWQRSDGAAEAVQNIALEKSPGVVRQVLRPGCRGKGGDSLDG